MSPSPARSFSPAQQRLVRQLWGEHGNTLGEAALSMGYDRDALLTELEDMRELGILEIDADERIQLVPPRIALANLLEAETAAMDATMARLGRMGSLVVALGEENEPARMSAEESRGRNADVEIFPGRPPSEILREWIDAGYGELRFLRPEQWRLPTEPEMAKAFRRAIGQGHTVRCIYPFKALQLARSVLEEHRATGEEMRLLPELPVQMAIVGSSRAMLVSGLGGDDLYTAVIREPLIVRFMIRYFEVLWDEGAAMPAGDLPRDRSEERRILLGELARGERDEQIARSMGLGLRTVRRRVADLMIDLGVETRFQAGVEAARRGWV